ncbi:acyl-CoA synthetase FdrA [Oscillospiraceae bacterium MB08-C2-2]|nr:acyl-CoA synthetase FdrA [Oscillospiraceae bacterium MB08-C2-2]
MIHTIIQQNSYMDSVELMLLSKKLGHFPGVNKATVMMGSAANLEIMKRGGFDCAELAKAMPNDMVIAVDTEDAANAEAIVEAVREALAGKGKQEAAVGENLPVVKSWEAVKALNPAGKVALISVPGEYAAEEAREALKLGMHVMLFSDNVSEEEERALKEEAHAKGLLVMGADCGTSVLSGVPLAFANRSRRGSIGIAGAAGTGIQEAAVMIERFGGGISHAIGTGGRDLHEAVGGITMKAVISMLEQDEETKVIAIISKPPAQAVKAELEKALASLKKPCVVLFLGEKEPKICGGVHYTQTTRQLARAAVSLAGLQANPLLVSEENSEPILGSNQLLLGLFSGGTLAKEAAWLAEKSMQLHGKQNREGYVLYAENCRILDLGDDLYTKGKPHPMMDPTARSEKLLELVLPLEQPAVVLLDVVLGQGSSEEPALELAQAIRRIRQEKAQENHVAFVVNLLGTEQDSQKLEKQGKLLTDAGAHVLYGNTEAAEAALGLAGCQPADYAEAVSTPAPQALPLEQPSEVMMELLRHKPGVVNVGLKGFAKDLKAAGADVVHFEWKPFAGGDKTLRRAIEFLDAYEFSEGPYRTVAEANQAVLDKITQSVPCLVDVVPAHTAAEVFSHGRLLLHAGPPMTWEEMTHPMQGSCVGAALFEGWAETEEEAWSLLRSGGVRFLPCHHAGFVGPMGGITSANMPVLHVRNTAGGNSAYCTMNEGIGQVLRFGAYSEPVIQRLRFMRDVLGPVLHMALQKLENGLNIGTMVSRAIAMGDEFHQRNIAASLVFLKEMAPVITGLAIPDGDKYSVIKFLADTDQFFLNIMMAASKAVMDYAATVECGTVVTVMSRNGKDFGVRISGMGSRWFTGPVNTPKGLYFTGFEEEMANPDMGDSAITETFGVGGMAMIAAPAVTRFVGTGGFEDALAISNRMQEICLAHNQAFPIPTWNFKGACLGIDSRKVVATGITPVINTGIAHKVAGQGQIGAGTVNPPLECFSQAVLAYAKTLGFDEVK